MIGDREPERPPYGAAALSRIRADDYYAAFFTDPDGLRLELVANRRLRDEIRECKGR